MKQFLHTTGSAGREAGLSAATMANYAKAGLIESVRAANGQLLLAEDAPARAREVYATRIARRGGNRRRA